VSHGARIRLSAMHGCSSRCTWSWRSRSGLSHAQMHSIWFRDCKHGIASDSGNKAEDRSKAEEENKAEGGNTAEDGEKGRTHRLVRVEARERDAGSEVKLLKPRSLQGGTEHGARGTGHGAWQH